MYGRCPAVFSNFASAALAASASLLATITAKLGSSACEVGRPDAGVLAEPGARSRAPRSGRRPPRPAPCRSARAASRPGSSVRMILPAAASASSRRSPSAGPPPRRRAPRRPGRATPGRPSPPDPDSPQAAAVSARTAQSERERGGAEHESSPFEIPVVATCHIDRRNGLPSVGRRPDRSKPSCIRAFCSRSCERRQRRTRLAPPRNRLQTARFRSAFRRRLKLCGTNDDNCVAKWDEVG